MLKYRLEIAGVDRSNKIEPGSVSFDMNAGGRGNAKFQTRDKGGTWKPTKGDTFEIIRQDVSPERILWSGVVGRVTEREARTWPNASLFCDVSCDDATAICDGRIVLRYYSELTGGTLGDVAYDLVADYLGDLGYTYSGPVALLGGITFAAITLREAFDQLASATGTSWTITSAKVVKFYGPGGAGAASISLTDAAENYIEARITRLQSRHANRVYVRNNKDLGAVWTDTFSGNGVNTMFPTVYQLPAAPVVKVNGTVQNVVEFAEIGSGGYDFYWFQDGIGVVQNPESTPLGGGDVLEVSYASPLPYIAIAESPASIATYGLFEEVVEVTDYTDKATLDAIALERVMTMAPLPAEIEISTFVDGFEPGQLLTINTAVPEINDSYLIESVSASEEDQIQFRYALRCSSQSTPQASRRANPATYFREIIDSTRRPIEMQDTSPASGSGSSRDNANIIQELLANPIAVGDRVMDTYGLVTAPSGYKHELVTARAIAKFPPASSPAGNCVLKPVYSTDDGATWQPFCTITIAGGDSESAEVTTFDVPALLNGWWIDLNVIETGFAGGVCVEIVTREALVVA